MSKEIDIKEIKEFYNKMKNMSAEEQRMVYKTPYGMEMKEAILKIMFPNKK